MEKWKLLEIVKPSVSPEVGREILSIKAGKIQWIEGWLAYEFLFKYANHLINISGSWFISEERAPEVETDSESMVRNVHVKKTTSLLISFWSPKFPPEKQVNSSI